MTVTRTKNNITRTVRMIDSYCPAFFLYLVICIISMGKDLIEMD
jgi:hypothetical protein